MPPRQPVSVFDSHEVTNQAPPLPDLNLFTTDPILAAAVARVGLPGGSRLLAPSWGAKG
jgi:hypothetical protein